jgi:hypothetical protein
MPTPRPASAVSSSAVEKPAADQLRQGCFVGFRIGIDQAALDGVPRMRFEVEAGTVVAMATTISLPSCASDT